VTEVGEFAREKKWEFSMGKTKKMKLAGGGVMGRLMLGEDEVEDTEEYKYLGVVVGKGEDYLRGHEGKVRGKGHRARGITKAVGKWAVCRPEVMRRVWKGAMVPMLTYGQEVLVLGKEVGKELDSIQREVGMRALGGTRLVAHEGLEGEWGCSSFKVRESRAKLGFEGRLRYMRGERWAKKVYQYVGVQGLNTKWEKKVRSLGEWKGVERRGLVPETEEQWVRRERGEVERQAERERMWRMDKKSSLRYYKMGGGKGNSGKIYDGSYGSDLLFRARVGALEEGGD